MITKALITKELVSVVSEKVRDVILDQAFQKLRDRRTAGYFSKLVELLATLEKTPDHTHITHNIVAKLTANDDSIEFLYDQYRRVCLAASVTLGPRILAMVTATLVSEGRFHTTPAERIYIDLASNLSDMELSELKNELLSLRALLPDRRVVGRKLQNGRTVIAFLQKTNVEDLPTWFSKLQNLGVIFQKNSPGFVSSGEVIRISHQTYIFEESLGIIEMIEQAQGPV